MQIAIIIIGLIAAISFILSGISYFFHWGNFKYFALSFIASAIIMFILMIIRNATEEWEVGSYKKKK
jgi:hypothetical protein